MSACSPFKKVKPPMLPISNFFAPCAVKVRIVLRQASRARMTVGKAKRILRMSGQAIGSAYPTGSSITASSIFAQSSASNAVKIAGWSVLTMIFGRSVTTAFGEAVSADRIFSFNAFCSAAARSVSRSETALYSARRTSFKTAIGTNSPSFSISILSRQSPVPPVFANESRMLLFAVSNDLAGLKAPVADSVQPSAIAVTESGATRTNTQTGTAGAKSASRGFS